MADTSELYARGLKRRKTMFGEADVEKRMAVILNDDVRRAKGRSQLLNALEPPL